MYDLDTFLTSLYVVVDDFIHRNISPASAPSTRGGRKPSLTESEIVTLSLFAQWGRFRSERDFYRWAQQHLASYFPTLPDRSQFNRLTRQTLLRTQQCAMSLCEKEHAEYEILDGCGVAVRSVKRRGSSWLDGLANVGPCTRLGWYFGVTLLDCVTPTGMITGFALAPASIKDQRMAENFLEMRRLLEQEQSPVGQEQSPVGQEQKDATGHIPTVGQVHHGYYVLDKGFSGPHLHQIWEQSFDVKIVCAPQRGHGKSWPKPLRQWLASKREIIESVHEKLLNTFRLDRERPHALDGLLTRVAAKVGLHNFCIQMNRWSGRNDLEFADLIDW